MQILYEDNHILVVEKPVNVPVQADDSRDPDLLSMLKEYIKEKYSKPGNVYLGLVHRLDRPVGGVMVFARTSKAASRLSRAVSERDFHKTYMAVVQGVPSEKRGTLKDYLSKDQSTNTVTVTDEKHGKPAILDYEVMACTEGLSLIKINLHTGRSHQIRVQCASHGFPIWGDQRYNKTAHPGQQIALWASELSFTHPVSKQEMHFASPLPDSYPYSLFKGVSE